MSETEAEAPVTALTIAISIPGTLTGKDCQMILNEIGRALNKTAGVILASGQLGAANPVMANLLQSAASCEAALAALQAQAQEQRAGSLVQPVQMVPPRRMN